MILYYSNQDPIYVFDIFNVIADAEYTKDPVNFTDRVLLVNRWLKDNQHYFTERAKLLLYSIKTWNQYPDSYSGISSVIFDPPKRVHHAFKNSSNELTRSHNMMDGSLVIKVCNMANNVGGMVSSIAQFYDVSIPMRYVEFALLNPSAKSFYRKEDWKIYNSFISVVEDYTERGIEELTDGHYRYMVDIENV